MACHGWQVPVFSPEHVFAFVRISCTDGMSALNHLMLGGLTTTRPILWNQIWHLIEFPSWFLVLFYHILVYLTFSLTSRRWYRRSNRAIKFFKQEAKQGAGDSNRKLRKLRTKIRTGSNSVCFGCQFEWTYFVPESSKLEKMGWK